MSYDRSALTEKERQLLGVQASIFRMISQSQSTLAVISTVPLTDSNVVRTFSDETPTELLEYLDNSIDYLKYQEDSHQQTIGYQLKFKDDPHEFSFAKFDEIRNYVSS